MPAASSSFVWLLAAVFLAGGFAAGYVMGQGGDVLPDDEPLELEHVDAPGPAAAPVVTLERPEIPEEEPAELESARAAKLAPLREILAAMPPPDIPRGNGVISGTVKTAEGEGVAGVEIVLNPQRPRQGNRPKTQVEPEDLTVAVMKAIESVRWRRLARLQTTTAADGSYRFDTVADLDHWIRATLEGWQIHASDPRRNHQTRPGATIDFVARQVTRVPVTIVLPDGTTPDDAMIMMQHGGAMSGMGWSRQNPYLELQPGTWELTVTAGSARQFKSDPQTVTVVKGVAPEPLRFELESSGAIRGTIQYAPGERFQQGRVYLVRIPKGQKPDPSRLASSDQNAHLHAWGGSTPTFNFSDLAPGRYLLGLSRSYRGGITVTEEVEVGDEAVEVELKVPPLRREEYIVVSLLGPEGKPVAGAQLMVGRKSGGRSSSSDATVVEREDGTRWVMHPEGGTSASDADTTWWVEATHPQYGSQREEYRRTRASSVEIRFGKPGSLELTVSGIAGSRYEGRIGASISGTRANRSGKLDGEGQVTLPGVQPGSYTVNLTLGGDRGWRSQIHSEKVDVRSGENRIRIELPPLYEIEVLGAAGSAWLRSTGKGPRRFHRNFSVTAGDRATVDGLPAGEYEVRSGSKRAKFTLPGATTVQLE